MELRAAHCADVVILKPIGRVDHSNSDAFAQALAPHLSGCKSGGDAILFDLTGLDYISSAGLRVLMLASKKVTPAGGKVVLAAPQSVVKEILEISRFQFVFPIHKTVADGIAALSAKAAAAYTGTG